MKIRQGRIDDPFSQSELSTLKAVTEKIAKLPFEGHLNAIS